MTSFVTSFEKGRAAWDRQSWCFPRVKFVLHASADLANSTGTSGCRDRLGDQVKTCGSVDQGIG